MSQVMDRTGGQAVIEFAKGGLTDSKSRFLKALSFVPDDKLNWRPSETAKSALRIAAHVGYSNRLFKVAVLGGPFPTNDVAAIFGQLSQDELSITSRQQAIDLIEDSTSELAGAMDRVDPENIHETPDSPFGPLPVAFWLSLPMVHFFDHAGQLDYLQTIWGDLDPHMA